MSGNSPDPYRDFERLYDAVTRSLLAFVQSGRRRNQISDEEEDWFIHLTRAFYARFLDWKLTPPASPIYKYLLHFDDHGSRSLRLAGHAFLHVAHDLPIVIADTLRDTDPITRIRLRSLFLRPAPLFREVFLEHARKGYFGLLARPLGYLRAAEILSYWLLCLRATAWIHAESLADSPDSATLQSQLADALVEAAMRADGRIERLHNATMFQVAPPIAIASRFGATATAVTVGAVAVLATGAAIRFRNDRIANRIAYLGACVQIAASKAIMVREGSRPPPNATPAFA